MCDEWPNFVQFVMVRRCVRGSQPFITVVYISEELRKSIPCKNVFDSWEPGQRIPGDTCMNLRYTLQILFFIKKNSLMSINFFCLLHVLFI